MTGETIVAMDPPSVLIAEDNRFDQLILKRAFRAARLGVTMHFVEHGEALIDYLSREAGGAEAPAPAVIFLDLNMPVLNGWDAIRQLRAQPEWASIPIVVMSTLTQESEIARVYKSGANAYFTKPPGFDDMVAAIRSCTAPWLGAPGSEKAAGLH